MSLSPELVTRIQSQVMESAIDVASAVGYLDAKNLPPDVDEQIDVIGGALADCAELLRDVVNEVNSKTAGDES